jgi:hypothetical protein
MKSPNTSENLDNLNLVWDKSEELFEREYRQRESAEAQSGLRDLKEYFDFLEQCPPPKDVESEKSLPIDKRFEL